MDFILSTRCGAFLSSSGEACNSSVNNISVRKKKVQNCSYEVSSWQENYLCKYWVWRSNHFPSLSLTHTACLSLSTQIDVYRFETVNSLPISEFITWEHLQTDPVRKPELALPVSIPSDEPQARTVSLPLWGGCWGLCQKGVRSVSVCVCVCLCVWGNAIGAKTLWLHDSCDEGFTLKQLCPTTILQRSNKVSAVMEFASTMVSV